MSILAKLLSCKHENYSMLLPGDRLQTCFNCGATRRPDETDWTPIWLVRDANKHSTWKEIKERLGHGETDSNRS